MTMNAKERRNFKRSIIKEIVDFVETQKENMPKEFNDFKVTLDKSVDVFLQAIKDNSK